MKRQDRRFLGEQEDGEDARFAEIHWILHEAKISSWILDSDDPYENAVQNKGQSRL